jgi:prolyl oligopeptidase
MLGMQESLSAGAALAALMIVSLSARGADPGAPPSPQHPVVDSYHGVQVADPYRWLEDPQDPEVEKWIAAEDARTRRYLDGLPERGPIYDQLFSQTAATSSSYSRLYAVGGAIFALYTQPPKQQPMLALLTRSLDAHNPRIVVDPNAINPKGTTAIDWFVPSPNGKLIAVSMSENGSEDGTLHVFDVANGVEVGERIARVQYPTGGGSLAWRADATGFWYTRYPGPEQAAEEQHFFQQIFFHRLGEDPAKDTYVAGKAFPKVAEIHLDNHFDSDRVVASVANGDGGEFAHYLIAPDGAITKITDFADRIVAVTSGPDHALYLISRKDAPRGKLLRLDPGVSDLSRARVIVPESDAVIQGGGEFGGQPVAITARALYVRELIGGPSRVAIFDHRGKSRGVLPLPEAASVEEVEPLGDGSLLYSVETYLRPPYFSRYEEAAARAAETPLAQTSPADFSDAEVVRELAHSKDGTAVPLNIIRRKGAPLSSATPVLLNAYGGYGVSLVPKFVGPSKRLWLDGGGIFVIANLRGGGEFGEEWHAQGSLTHKQNVFDDFIGAAQYLIAHQYTSPEHLAIIGGSNGGLLMGAALTQHPELFRAVVSSVGIYDMLRVELDPNGAFNTTEYGSTKDPEQFQALYAYSPYHHVADGTVYPAIFMSTGATDGRVNPAHSRKMIARLQAATSSGKPVYLTVNSHAGHGIGSALSIRIGQMADAYAFLFDQLGMRLPPTATPPARPASSSLPAP